MLRVSAKNYIELGERVAETRINLYMVDSMSRDDPDQGLSDDERNQMREQLIKIWDICQELGLPVSGDLISSRVDQSNGPANIPESEREFMLLIDAVKSEIQSKLFLFVPSHLAPLYENSSILSDRARAAFPSSAVEMSSAGNCIAAGLSTACVFHCMRAVEHGLRALATDVDVDFGAQQWQNVIEQIEASVQQFARTEAAGPQKAARLKFLSGASSSFRHFKDGWRNHVMHTRASYDETQATVVFDQVKIFLESLSENLREIV